MLIGMRRSPSTRAAGAMSVATMMQARIRQTTSRSCGNIIPATTVATNRQGETPSRTSRTSRPVVRRRSFFT
ncbi:hypothetical protein ACFCVO_19945, partial [Agromyces sp. NPDC056379]|uniref:hypothetical protein n=1 Tax=Agromyces sp. NPDC056379 TaxID=3345802 RepID=UPI0035D6A8D8